MTVDRRSYSSGHFELLIDGHSQTPYLKSVEGGHTKASLVSEAVGTRLNQIKHVSTMDVDPFSIEFSLSGAKDILNWIGQSWNKTFGRRHGQITHADFNLEQAYLHEFYEALITETTFPTLDGSSKEAAYLKVKMQPETISTKMLQGGKYSPGSNTANATKHQMWLPSAFRFSIDGMDDMRYVNKIDSFTNNNGHKTGAIEFLSTDRKSSIFRIVLDEVGLLSAQLEPSKANAESIKRVKFEFYVGSMKIDQSDMSGLQS